MPFLGHFDGFCSIVMRATVHLRETHLPLTSDQCFVGAQSEHAWFQGSFC